MHLDNVGRLDLLQVTRAQVVAQLQQALVTPEARVKVVLVAQMLRDSVSPNAALGV